MDSPSLHDSAASAAGTCVNPKSEMPNLHEAGADTVTSTEACEYLENVFLPCAQRETSVASASIQVLGDLIDAACIEVAYECIRLSSIGAFSSPDHVSLAPNKLPAVTCPNCGASVGISKFVPHLATCMNIGGRRRARPSAPLASSSRDGHMSPSEFDFGSDDDDTAFGSRKKKIGHALKVKTGETKTYGSKGKSKTIPSVYVSESSSLSNVMSDPFEFL